MFSSRAFVVIAVVEVAAIRVGIVGLDVSGFEEYVIAWVALVVGAHFVAFGRLFWPGFQRLGAALVAAGCIGIAVGATGGSPGAIKAITGLLAAISLFAAGAWAGASSPSRA